jgi:hypothetical protein
MHSSASSRSFPCDYDQLRLRELLNIASDHTALIAANCEDLASPRQLACLKVFERRPGAMPYVRVYDTVQASSNGTTTCCPSSSKQGREAAIRVQVQEVSYVRLTDSATPQPLFEFAIRAG